MYLYTYTHTYVHICIHVSQDQAAPEESRERGEQGHHADAHGRESW